MDAYTKKFWVLVQDNLGQIAEFLGPISKMIRIPLGTDDIGAIRARAFELNEAGKALIELSEFVLEVTEDGAVDVAETSGFLVKVETVLDQFEDVLTGVDEDNPPKPVTKKTAKKKTAKKK